MTEKHKNVHVALAAAQAEMGRAIKDVTNPHFRQKYADLGNVMDACMPALSKHGISVVQPFASDENERCIKTVLTHGETESSVECAIPLILGKNDMQGLGSAITYARRYGLMTMTGIAPDDDDGNAAAATGPAPEIKSFAQTITDEMDPDSTPEERAQAIAEAVERLWPRKKTPGQLQNAWTKLENEGLFRRLEKQHPALYDRVFDAYEEQLRKVSPEPQVAAE